MLRTQDALVGGAAEREARIIVSVKGDRMRQEATGSRTMVTRRGARYQKPGHRLTLDQNDTRRRFEIDLDANTYVEETFADARQRHEAELAAAEKALGIGPAKAIPTLAVSVDRTGERLRVHGREREQHRLGGVALRWEWVFSGPHRDEPEATLLRHLGEVTRIESGWLDARGFELPSGLTREPRSSAVRSLDNAPRPMLYLALPGEQLLKRPSRGGPT